MHDKKFDNMANDSLDSERNEAKAQIKIHEFIRLEKGEKPLFLKVGRLEKNHFFTLKIVRIRDGIEYREYINFSKGNQVLAIAPKMGESEIIVYIVGKIDQIIPKITTVSSNLLTSMTWATARICSRISSLISPVVLPFLASNFWPIEAVKTPFHKAEAKDCTIIVPTRNSFTTFSNLCRKNLVEILDDGAQLIIILHKCQCPKTIGICKELEGKGALILHDDGEFNYSRLINFGASFAQREMLILLNDDVVFPNADEILLNAGIAKANPESVVGVAMKYPDLRAQHLGICLGIGGIAGHIGRTMDTNSFVFRQIFTGIHEVPALTGAAQFVSKSFFDKLNGYDNGYEVECSDLDFCLKAKKMGGRNLINYDSFATHNESSTRKDQNGLEFQMRNFQDRERFLLKWFDEIHTQRFFPSFLDKRQEKLQMKCLLDL